MTVFGTTPRGKPDEKLLKGADLGHHFGKRARKGKSLESKIKPVGLKLPS